MVISTSEFSDQKGATIDIDPPERNEAVAPVTSDSIPSDSVSNFYNNNSFQYLCMYRYQPVIMEIIQKTLILCWR